MSYRFKITLDDPIDGTEELELSLGEVFIKFPWVKDVGIDHETFMSLRLVTDMPETILIEAIHEVVGIKDVKFMDWTCKAVFANYCAADREGPSERIAISLIDAINDEPVATATVNIPGALLRAHQVIIKNYSENAGMDKALIDAGIIRVTPVGSVSAGHVLCPVYELTEAAQSHIATLGLC